MCLGIPGQVVAIEDSERRLGRVDVGGVQRVTNLACVAPDRGRMEELIGEWVLIHVGFAMSRIDRDEAARTMALLEELGEVQHELDAMREHPASGLVADAADTRSSPNTAEENFR